MNAALVQSQSKIKVGLSGTIGKGFLLGTMPLRVAVTNTSSEALDNAKFMIVGISTASDRRVSIRGGRLQFDESNGKPVTLNPGDPEHVTIGFYGEKDGNGFLTCDGKTYPLAEKRVVTFEVSTRDSAPVRYEAAISYSPASEGRTSHFDINVSPSNGRPDVCP